MISHLAKDPIKNRWKIFTQAKQHSGVNITSR